MHIKFLSLSRCSWIATIIFMAKEQTKIPWWGILYRMMAQEEENTLTNENSKNTIANDSLWWEGAGVVSQRNSCGCIGIFSMNSDIFFFNVYWKRRENFHNQEQISKRSAKCHTERTGPGGLKQWNDTNQKKNISHYIQRHNNKNKSIRHIWRLNDIKR